MEIYQVDERKMYNFQKIDTCILQNVRITLYAKLHMYVIAWQGILQKFVGCSTQMCTISYYILKNTLMVN